MAYRFSRGLADEDADMCVGVMEMVDAVCGGVLYSASPMNIRDQSVIINSTWGLPKAVVDGTTATDLFRVAKSPALSVTAPGNRRQREEICLSSGRRCLPSG
jgi:pyruvate,water dikinase